LLKEFSLPDRHGYCQLLHYLLDCAEDLCSSTFDNYDEPGTLWVNNEGNRCIDQGFLPRQAMHHAIRTENFIIASSDGDAKIIFFKVRGEKIVGFISYPDPWVSAFDQAVPDAFRLKISTCRKLLFVVYRCAGEHKLCTYSIWSRKKLSERKLVGKYCQYYI
jgi:hypothetical protein